jgi:hypothetical protein
VSQTNIDRIEWVECSAVMFKCRSNHNGSKVVKGISTQGRKRWKNKAKADNPKVEDEVGRSA